MALERDPLEQIRSLERDLMQSEAYSAAAMDVEDEELRADYERRADDHLSRARQMAALELRADDARKYLERNNHG